MQFWIIQTLNSIAFGGLLFLLSSGFSLAFGLMRIPNLAHGGFFMLGAYLGATITWYGGHFWIAVLGAGLGVGLIGILFERLILRRQIGRASCRERVYKAEGVLHQQQKDGTCGLGGLELRLDYRRDADHDGEDLALDA